MRSQSVPVGILICADLGQPHLARALRAQGARVLIHVTDESSLRGWAGRLHARVARLRALELGIPVVRVANAGPSQWIGADGSVMAELASGGSRVATHEVHLSGSSGALPLQGSTVLAGLSLCTGVPVCFLAFRLRPRRTTHAKEKTR